MLRFATKINLLLLLSCINRKIYKLVSLEFKMVKINVQTYVEIPYVGKVATAELRLDYRVEQAIRELGFDLSDFGKHRDGTLTKISGEEALALLKKLGTRMLTADEYVRVYEYAKKHLNERLFRRLARSMDHFFRLTTYEMVKLPNDNVVCATRGKITRISCLGYDFKYDPQGIFPSIVGFREVKEK